MKARKIIRSQKGEDRRNLIVDAAAISFALDEFSGTSHAHDCGEAGVSQSLIHYHFATKEQLFAEVFSRFMDPMNSRRIALIEKLSKEGPEEEEARRSRSWIQILICTLDRNHDKRDQTGAGVRPIRDQKCISK